MNKKNLRVFGVFAAFKAFAVVLAVSFFVSVPGGAASGASEFGFDLALATAQRSFGEKVAAQELVMKKYPALGADVFSLLESKYKDLPAEIPVIVHSAVCEKDRTNGLKTARALLSMFRKNYPGALTKIAEGFSNKVLKKYPGIVEAMAKKRMDIRKASMAQLAGEAEKIKEAREAVKVMMSEKHPRLAETVKKAVVENAMKVPVGTVIDLAKDFSKLRDEKYPGLNEAADALMKENPEMKKPAAIVTAALKNPDFFVEAVKLAESKYSQTLYDFIDGVIVSLENDRELDLFAVRQDVARTVSEKIPDLFFILAKIKNDNKISMSEFVRENYPELPVTVASILDSALPGFSKNVFAAFEAANPGASSKIIAGVRAKYPGLEKDIDSLLKAKYPSLLEEISFGK